MVRHLSLLLLLASAGFAVADELGPQTKIAIFEDTIHKQWCAYHDGRAADAMVQKIDTNNVGDLFYSNGRLSKIVYEVQNESGDFLVDDNYFLNSDGALVRFEQRTNTFDGNVSALESYTVEDGIFHKVSVKYFDLTTHKPIHKPKDMYPQPGAPFHKKLEELPFYALLQNQAVLTDAKTCVREN